jgi:uncharacterized damage-inducible protein DinB
MSDMWLPPDQDPRQAQPAFGEQAVVRSYLTHYRQTFELKLDGLDPEQLARRSVPPSTLSLLGLLRHLAQMEQHWSRRVLQAQDVPRLFKTEDDRDHDFNGAVGDPEVVAEAWAAWRAEADEMDAWLDRDTDWSRLIEDGDGSYEVRDVVVHVVEEYARHVGHADLLRECIDGRTGQ